MQYMSVARSLIGTKEISGPEDSPVIMGMYKALGHDWVEHDEVAWCAAFVGFALEEGGIRSTRKLNARSYEKFGMLVYKPGVKGKLSDAKEGDICVFKRGSSSWQGHVAFYIRATKKSVYVLGGNQNNAVNIKPYALSKLICIVRPVADFGQDSMTMKEVQQKLIDLGYFEVGKVDGIMGTRTKGAILAFREDNGLPLVPTVDGALEEALKKAPKRFISSERSTGKPNRSRILSGANMITGASAVGGASSLAVGVLEAATAVGDGVEKAEGAKDAAGRALDLLGLAELVAPYWPFITAAIFAIALVIAWKVRSARIDDYQEGRTP